MTFCQCSRGYLFYHLRRNKKRKIKATSKDAVSVRLYTYHTINFFQYEKKFWGGSARSSGLFFMRYNFFENGHSQRISSSIESRKKWLSGQRKKSNDSAKFCVIKKTIALTISQKNGVCVMNLRCGALSFCITSDFVFANAKNMSMSGKQPSTNPHTKKVWISDCGRVFGKSCMIVAATRYPVAACPGGSIVFPLYRIFPIQTRLVPKENANTLAVTHTIRRVPRYAQPALPRSTASRIYIQYVHPRYMREGLEREN